MADSAQQATRYFPEGDEIRIVPMRIVARDIRPCSSIHSKPTRLSGLSRQEVKVRQSSMAANAF